MHGFTGFITPYSFYTSLLTELNKICESVSYTVNFRLHPNLYHGLSSDYSSHRDRSSAEEQVTFKLVAQLVDHCNKLSIPFYFSSPDIPLKYILSPQLTCVVTHHGSIGIEAAVAGLPTITSHLSPFLDADLPNVCLFSDTTPSSRLASFLEYIKSCPSLYYSAVASTLASSSDRYRPSHFKVFLSTINRKSLEVSSMNFDKYIYTNSLSWQSTRSLPPLQLSSTFGEYVDTFCHLIP